MCVGGRIKYKSTLLCEWEEWLTQCEVAVTRTTVSKQSLPGEVIRSCGGQKLPTHLLHHPILLIDRDPDN